MALGSGGLFLSADDHARPIGTSLRLFFEVPGGIVQAEAVAQRLTEGMGVEFTNVGPQARVLLDRLRKRLLQ